VTSNYMLQMLAFIVKGAKKVWTYWKMYLYYFEKSLSIVFIESFIHYLELCLVPHEIGILWIMLLKFFVICKALVEWVYFQDFKILNVFFCYSNLHQMFSNVLWTLIYFIRRATCVDPFRCTYIDLLKYVVDSNF